MVADTRSADQIIDEIVRLQGVAGDRKGFRVTRGLPVDEGQKAKVAALLSEDFLPLFERFNGSSNFGILFSLYTIEEIESRPELDFVILSDMQAYYPELKGDVGEFSTLGSFDSVNGWYHRPSGRIFICSGGETLDTYTSVRSWLVEVERSLAWLSDH